MQTFNSLDELLSAVLGEVFTGKRKPPVPRVRVEPIDPLEIEAQAAFWELFGGIEEKSRGALKELAGGLLKAADGDTAMLALSRELGAASLALIYLGSIETIRTQLNTYGEDEDGSKVVDLRDIEEAFVSELTDRHLNFRSRSKPANTLHEESYDVVSARVIDCIRASYQEADRRAADAMDSASPHAPGTA